jgi:acyl-lipid omega-6 desaturase (Delta-12 desaturase)
MEKAAYVALKKELTSEKVFQINSNYGLLTVLVEGFYFTTVLVLLFRTSPFTCSYWILELLGGLSIFRFFVILHECGHKNLFQQKYLNSLMGYFVSVVCLHPFETWCEVHDQHHRWVGIADKDPALAALLEIKRSPKLQALFSLFWKLWLPIGFIKHLIVVFWIHPLQKSRQQPIQFYKILLSACLTSFPHLVLLIWLGIPQYLMLFAPMFLVFCFWNEIVQVSFHVGLNPVLSQYRPKPFPYPEQDVFTRDIVMPSFLSVLLGYNFYLHLEHHLFPTAPWYRLPLIQHKLHQLSGVSYNKVELVSHTLKTRSQDPKTLLIDSLPSVDASSLSEQSRCIAESRPIA